MASAIDDQINSLRESILTKARHFTAHPEVGKALGYSPQESSRLHATNEEQHLTSASSKFREMDWVRCIAEQDVHLAYHWHVEEGLADFYDLVIVPIKAVRFSN